MNKINFRLFYAISFELNVDDNYCSLKANFNGIKKVKKEYL